ncbi:hypothetical protein ATE71_03270 [Sphingopyxis sp. H115]|nr:hypothetical protein ATE71_03270 [Sphingopyxis sp. H115]
MGSGPPLFSRRTLMVQGAALLALLPGCSRAAESAQSMSSRWSPEVAELIGKIPYERIEVPGSEALTRWEALRLSRQDVWPVVVGGDDDLGRMAEQLLELDDRPVEAILAAGAGLEHPKSLWDLRAREKADWADYLKAHPELGPEGEEYVAELGDWPAVPPDETAFTVANDILSGQPYPQAHILLLPTTRSWDVPAYLKWGGWNACPPAEIHVAAMRRWATNYGAEIVGISGDVMNIKVQRRPTDRDEAIALAREQYAYCSDIVDQGVGGIAALAAGLMTSDWWYFWWD